MKVCRCFKGVSLEKQTKRSADKEAWSAEKNRGYKDRSLIEVRASTVRHFLSQRLLIDLKEREKEEGKQRKQGERVRR